MTEDQQQPQQHSTSLGDDPVVEEVRATRRRLWDAAGRDVRRFIERTRQAEERRAADRPKRDAR